MKSHPEIWQTINQLPRLQSSSFGIVRVLLLINAPAEFRIPGSEVPQTSAQAGIVCADSDGVLALVVEQDGFFFVLGETAGHVGSFQIWGIKKATGVIAGR